MIIALAALAAASVQPSLVTRIDPRHRLVEGVATDGRMLWVSSVLDREILACPVRRNGTAPRCRTIARLPSGLHPMGLAWDSARQRLWVAADCPELPGIARCASGALLGLDRTGKVRERPQLERQAFHPGDVSAGGGEVYVSDSRTGAVYWVAPDGDLANEVPTGDGKSAQGSALDPSGRRLILADYSRGIVSIDLDKAVRTALPREDGKPLRGIDGLVRCGSTYYGVYNGTAPGTVVAWTINGQRISYGPALAGLEIPDPTQIAHDGKRLLVVADAGWEAVSKPGARRKRGAAIVSIPLDRNCRPH